MRGRRSGRGFGASAFAVGGALVGALTVWGSGALPSSAAVTVSASGRADAFGPPFGRVEGATVRAIGVVGFETVTDADGFWQLDGLPEGSEVSFELSLAGRPTTQTRRFTLTAADLVDVAFQSPTQQLFDGFAGVIGVTPDPARCTIAATVTRRGFVYGQWPFSTHGEPDATVTLSPAPPGGVDGPIYFNLVRGDLIWPDRSLTGTTLDGGVVFANVPVGVYTLHADKAGAVIPDVTIDCRAGVLVNAAPPFGLSVVDGGLDPSDDAFATSTTSPAVPGPSPPSSAPADALPVVAPSFAG